MTGVDLATVRRHVEQLRVLKDARKTLDDAEAEAKAAIKEALGDHEEGTLDGKPVVTWKSSKRTALNQAALKAEYPETYALCQETTVVRTFRVIEVD